MDCPEKSNDVVQGGLGKQAEFYSVRSTRRQTIGCDNSLLITLRAKRSAKEKTTSSSAA